MCGINGIIFKSKQDINTVKQTITQMNDLIIHRGPDDHGTSEQASVAMLSLIHI